MAAVAAFGGNTCVNCRKGARARRPNSKAPMTTEAIARLRGCVTLTSIHVTTVRAADLRALLDAHTALEAAHTEALDALVGLEDACASVASWSEECLDYSDSRRIAARTVLAKAGRR